MTKTGNTCLLNNIYFTFTQPIENMDSLTINKAKEIAEELDMGLRCFVHRETLEAVFVPDMDKFSGFDSEVFDEDLKKIENNTDAYFEIEQPTSSDSFRIMSDFANSLDDNVDLKLKLIRALNNSKPFREFKFLIDQSVSHRQAWFDFKSERLILWVQERFRDEMNSR